MKINISTFFQSTLNVFLFRHLSPRAAQAYIQRIGALFYSLFNRKEKRLIERNVWDVFEGQEERFVKKVVHETFRGIFTHYFEKMFAAFFDFEDVLRYVREHFQVSGKELIAEALQKGKGCILVTAHWGGVEFIPWMLFLLGFPASIIMECSSARLARCLLGRTRRVGTELISSCFGGSILMRAMQALKSNRVLMTQCDEVDAWHKRRRSTIQLFGKELFFDNTIDVLSHRSESPVVAAFLKRCGNGHYNLIIEDVSVEKKPESTSRNVLELWQSYVRQYPEQWYQWKKWQEMKTA